MSSLSSSPVSSVSVSSVAPAIRRLPEVVINRIAAGEIVERPASVVKELIENSIDAQARQIEVIVRNAGRTAISVIDDGFGMTSDQLSLAIDPHTTSKLPDDTLATIRTLGFRGEALASIGSVSRLTITSRARLTDGHYADKAWSINNEAGTKGSLILSAYPNGTRVDIADLFYKTPARLKFLKSARTEITHLRDIVERFALAYPHIAFTLTAEKRKIVHFDPPTTHDTDMYGTRDITKRLGSVFGPSFLENSVRVDITHHQHHLSGYISLPTFHSINTSRQFLFVNQRPIREKILYGAIHHVYRDFIPHDRHPVLVLFLELPPDSIDVNVHPAKTEVRFHHNDVIRELMIRGMEQALVSAGHRAVTTTGKKAISLMHTDAKVPSKASSTSVSPEQVKGGMDYHQPIDTLPNLPLPPSMPQQILPDNQEQLNTYPLGAACTQVHSTYIISQTPESVIITDQHAAHERLVYERLKNSMKDKQIPSQGLAVPVIVTLDEPSVQRLIEHQETFRHFGFEIERFGVSDIIIRMIPAMLTHIDIVKFIGDIADELREHEHLPLLEERINMICSSMACHGSIRAGQALSLEEMNSLLRQIETTPYSGQCNHGRPTHIVLSRTDIERLFGRR